MGAAHGSHARVFPCRLGGLNPRPKGENGSEIGVRTPRRRWRLPGFARPLLSARGARSRDAPCVHTMARSRARSPGSKRLAPGEGSLIDNLARLVRAACLAALVL